MVLGRVISTPRSIIRAFVRCRSLDKAGGIVYIFLVGEVHMRVYPHCRDVRGVR
jgi:hypothetical protein